jgi:hypothetical protein
MYRKIWIEKTIVLGVLVVVHIVYKNEESCNKRVWFVYQNGDCRTKYMHRVIRNEKAKVLFSVANNQSGHYHKDRLFNYKEV